MQEKPVVNFTKQSRCIVAANGLARSYIGFYKDVKTDLKYATHRKV